MAKRTQKYEYKVGQFVRVLPNYVELGGDQLDYLDDAINHDNKFEVIGGGITPTIYIEDEDNDNEWCLPGACVRPYGVKKTVIIYDSSKLQHKVG